MRVKRSFTRELCADFETNKCPCVLAQVNYCPICSYLGNSADCNDCNWAGRCVYMDFKFQNPVQPPHLKETCVQHVKSFHFPGTGMLYFAFTASSLINSLSPMTTVHLVHYQQPQYVSIPGVVVDCFPGQNLVILALNVYSVREKYFLEQNKRLTIRLSNQPSVLSLNKLTPAHNTLIVASNFGKLLVEPVAKRFARSAVTISCLQLPSLLEQRLNKWQVTAEKVAPRNFRQLVSLGNHTQHRQLLKQVSSKQSLQIAMLNTNLFT
ncbi:MAG: hypothetical protein H0Z35_02425 [Thermoanaerobacteraceae bacterium]|nr:hypothetical protein [Thermoanaerobacteraceae bacterium]